MVKNLLKSFMAIVILALLVLVGGLFLLKIIDRNMLDPVCVKIVCEQPWGMESIEEKVVLKGYNLDFQCTEWVKENETEKGRCDSWVPTASYEWMVFQEKYSLPSDIEFKKCWCEDMMSDKEARRKFDKPPKVKDGTTL